MIYICFNKNLEMHWIFVLNYIYFINCLAISNNIFDKVQSGSKKIKIKFIH